MQLPALYQAPVRSVARPRHWRSHVPKRTSKWRRLGLLRRWSPEWLERLELCARNRAALTRVPIYDFVLLLLLLHGPRLKGTFVRDLATNSYFPWLFWKR